MKRISLTLVLLFALSVSVAPAVIAATRPPKGPLVKNVAKRKKPVAAAGSFTPPCALAFDKVKTDNLSIDKSCGPTGKAAPKTPNAEQNMAKNNFCASGAPATITPDTLKALQAASKSLPQGSEGQLPTDRSVLKGISAGGKKWSEGDLVRMTAFIIESHVADLQSGESVNCGVADDPDSNDIHIALGSAYGADECTSVTAEMSPHFRPRAWTKKVSQILGKDKAGAHAAPISQHPVRIVGQLFFDASHKPCPSGGKALKGQPARQSLWEIHPVYGADVCKKTSLAECKAEDDSVWTPLADF